MTNRFGLQIRAATGADAPAIAALLALAGRPERAETLTLRLDAIRTGGSGTVLLALEWGPPSGLVAFHWAPTLFADHPVAEISALLVGPDERRRGIGRLLLKAAAQAARTAGCDTLRFAAPVDAPDLLAFCAASGFETAGTSLVRSLRRRS